MGKFFKGVCNFLKYFVFHNLGMGIFFLCQFFIKCCSKTSLGDLLSNYDFFFPIFLKSVHFRDDIFVQTWLRLVLLKIDKIYKKLENFTFYCYHFFRHTIYFSVCLHIFLHNIYFLAFENTFTLVKVTKFSKKKKSKKKKKKKKKKK